jgi:drug/metabolite transporter (DMT)-like permease
MSLKGLSKAGLFHLLVIYIIWSTTYLAIRVGVRAGSGFTPFMFGTIRILIAGVIMLIWSAIARQRMRLTRRELLVMASSGLLLWVGGNGMVLLGEQRTDSHLAALFMASMPIWSAGASAVFDRKLPSPLLAGALLLGTSGIVLLSMPVILGGLRADLISLLELGLATVCWLSGMLVQNRFRTELPGTVSSGYQMLFGGLGYAGMVLILGEPIPHPTPEAWAALVYLIIFGSLIAFTSFVQALRLLPIQIVTTYSYVNPVLAILLGWLILGEHITPWAAGGAAVILLGVTGVFRALSEGQNTRPAKNKVQDDPA